MFRSSQRAKYQADIRVGQFELRLFATLGPTGWLAKILDLKSHSYPFRAHHAADSQHVKEIAQKLAYVYTGHALSDVVWVEIPSEGQGQLPLS